MDCSGGGLVAFSEAKSEEGVNIVSATEADDKNKKKRVVVLGTGWAGTSFLKNLKDPSYDVQVISPRNFFAFTPLLPSVTCGTVEARSIVEPIRNIVRKVISLRKSIEILCYTRMSYKALLSVLGRTRSSLLGYSTGFLLLLALV